MSFYIGLPGNGAVYADWNKTSYGMSLQHERDSDTAEHLFWFGKLHVIFTPPFRRRLRTA